MPLPHLLLFALRQLACEVAHAAELWDGLVGGTVRSSVRRAGAGDLRGL